MQPFFDLLAEPPFHCSDRVSEHWDHVPRRLNDVVVDGEEYHEAEEEAARREEVPDVVVVVEVEQPARRFAQLIEGCVIQYIIV